MAEPPVNVSTLRKMKQDGEPIACLTAYDASYAALVDTAGTDVVLVGDSLGMVVQGHDTTVPVTVDNIVYHTQAPWSIRPVPTSCSLAILSAWSYRDTIRRYR